MCSSDLVATGLSRGFPRRASSSMIGQHKAASRSCFRMAGGARTIFSDKTMITMREVSPSDGSLAVGSAILGSSDSDGIKRQETYVVREEGE